MDNKKEITRDQIGIPLPDLVGAKYDALILEGKEYTNASERWGKAFYRKGKGKLCLLVDIETGEIIKALPSEKSLLTMGVVILRGLIAGEFDSDEPVTANTLKELMSSYSDDEKKAIWSQLTPEEKNFLKGLPKDPVRVEKNILYVDQDLPGVFTKCDVNFTDDITSVIFKGQVYNFFIRMGDVLEFTDKDRTKTLMVNIFTNALCLTEFISPPLKKSKDGVEMWIGNTPYQLSHRHYNNLPHGFGQMPHTERVEIIEDMREQDRLIIEAQELERRKKEVWESAGKKPKATPRKKKIIEEQTPELFNII